MRAFVSYAHDDHKECLALLRAMGGTAREFGLNIWHDNRIGAGTAWNDEIQRNLEAADVFLVLISNNLLNSDYIRIHELPAIEAQHKLGGRLLLPVLLKRCHFQGWPFLSARQVFPSVAGRLKAVCSFRPQSDGHFEVIGKVRDELTTFQAEGQRRSAATGLPLKPAHQLASEALIEALEGLRLDAQDVHRNLRNLNDPSAGKPTQPALTIIELLLAVYLPRRMKRSPTRWNWCGACCWTCGLRH